MQTRKNQNQSDRRRFSLRSSCGIKLALGDGPSDGKNAKRPIEKNEITPITPASQRSAVSDEVSMKYEYFSATTPTAMELTLRLAPGPLPNSNANKSAVLF